MLKWVLAARVNIDTSCEAETFLNKSVRKASHAAEHVYHSPPVSYVAWSHRIKKTKGSRRRRDPLTVAIFLHLLPRECKRLRATPIPHQRSFPSCPPSCSRNSRTDSTNHSAS